jgi:mannose-1-phosphate guanylyltransferase
VAWNSKIGSWCRIEGTPPFASENLSPASNISDLGSNVWTQAYTDLMLPSGQKNQSVTILGEQVRVLDETCVRNCIVLPHKELKNSFKNEILM